MRVLFIFNDFSPHNRIISDYLRARPQDEVSLVKVQMVVKGKSRFASLKNMLSRLSPRFIAGKVAESAAIHTFTWCPKVLRRGAVFKRLRWIALRNELPFFKTRNVMSNETLDFIRAQKPDLVVTLVHQILREKLIAIPRCGIINIHPGILPHFRGIQPYFWELSESFGRAGATLHLIEDEGIDTGCIVASGSYATWPGMSVHLNYYLTCQVASALLPKCVGLFEANHISPLKQNAAIGDYFRWPDDAAFQRLDAAGHPFFSSDDLYQILKGDYDDFSASVVRFCRTNKLQ